MARLLDIWLIVPLKHDSVGIVHDGRRARLAFDLHSLTGLCINFLIELLALDVIAELWLTLFD